ncbi:hypothetical protein [Pseudoalteromonas sp. P1-11]|uniref:hypothetical protein n=1 Tax=Pseudoalteromonas sp. P1-11 TaxID=1715254 RepID=UPI0006DC0E04|nr:hypothetical protein [Pseudoalteromonas sp. P1-11]KPW02268.1 hypothetical protein AN390_01647 [Pseudoalteromonas sp. P1-11]
MKIEPLQGLDILKFGSSKEDALNLFGEPDVIENEGGKDGIRAEIWEYKEIGIRLDFDPDFNFILERVFVYSADISLNGFFPIGLTEQELLNHYPSLELEVKGGRFADYVDNSIELLFFLKDNIVKRVDVLPKISDYFEQFGAYDN